MTKACGEEYRNEDNRANSLMRYGLETNDLELFEHMIRVRLTYWTHGPDYWCVGSKELDAFAEAEFRNVPGG